MKLLETTEDVLDQENYILPKVEKEQELTDDEKLFNRMADFIINLNPDNLSEEQVDEIMDFIEYLEEEYDDDIQEVRTARLARRTPQDKNQYSKRWYRKNRNAIKRRKAKLARSSHGRKRAKMRERLKKIGKTATGRRKVRYHKRKKAKEEKEKEMNK